MNKDNAKDYLPLVQALAEGKTIQYRPLDEDIATAAFPKGVWTDITTDFNLGSRHDRYRIKPEPWEFEVWSKGSKVFNAYDYHQDEDWLRVGYTKIKVREVLE